MTCRRVGIICDCERLSSSLPGHLKSRLKEYGLVTPFSTDSHGHFLSHLLSATHKQRVKREASPSTGTAAAEQKLYFNISAFGKEFHLRLRPNQQLVAPGAMVEWHDQVWEPPGNHTDDSTPAGNASSSAANRTEAPGGSERILRRELLKTDCTFVGDITDVPGASVAINNCDGLVSSSSFVLSWGRRQFYSWTGRTGG